MNIHVTLKLAAAHGALALALGAVPALAQQPAIDCADANNDGACDTPAELGTNADGSSANAGTIIVTGSRIRRDEFSTVEPITVITSKEITQSGFNSAADAIQSSEVTAGASQINDYFGGFVTEGGTGANTIGLRGLGASRTLVLLNGRRLAPAGTRGQVGSVDLNVLPTAIIERIEVLKAGASSIYGSDAIAGVINIITDRDVDGLYLEGQVNVPEVGAGVARRLSVVGGYNGDRFKISGSLDYYKRDRLSRNDRGFTRCPINGFVTSPDAALGSDDYIDPLTGQPKCFPLDNSGVTINTIGVSSRPAVPGLGTVPTANGRYNRLRPNAAVTTGVPGFEGVSLDSRDTFDPRQEEEDLLTPAEIYTGYVQASYELGVLGDAEAYVELLGNRRKSSALGYRQLSLDYPVGSPLIPAIFQDSDLGGPSETTNGENIGVRSFIGYGNLNSRQRVDFAKVGGGLRGTFGFLPDWRYDAYLSKSWTDAKYTGESFLISRLAAATAVQQNANGTFSCTTVTTPACVPAPVLTPAVIGGQFSQAFRDYAVANITGKTKFREFVAAFNTDGSIFTLPGGEAKLALGAEYRKSRLNDTPPPESVAGDLLNLSAAQPTFGSDSVWELFGEVYLPLLSDVSFAHRLNVTASLRYTEYESYGGDETYKIAAEWEPFKGFGFRGSYGTSYRAPALFEQFLGATSGFQSNQFDPCNEYGAEGMPVLAANCASEGLAPDFLATSGIRIFSGGGAAQGLEAETSKNWTVGVVVQPRLPESIGQFSASLDYFDIRVKNSVSQIGEVDILQKCYASTDFGTDAGLCRFVSRDPLNDNQLTVLDNYVNIATDVSRGWEFNLRYARGFGPVNLVLNAIVTKYEEQSSKLFPDEPKDEFNGTIGVPDWVGSFNANLGWDKWTLRYGLDWVGGDDHRTERFYEEEFGDPTGLFLRVDDYFLHNLSLTYDMEDKFSFTFGVRNLLDKDPPRVSTTFGQVYNTVGNAPLYSGYDFTGREFFVSVGGKF